MPLTTREDSGDEKAAPEMLTHFTGAEIDTGETTIFVRWRGSGPPLLLLHGFPQTHLMWHAVAPLLSRHFTVVCADLRGYGRSGCPRSTEDHAPYSKRALARDMVSVMEHLGFTRFSVVGHDRGGRVAYRLALDHPARVDRLAVLDVLPTETVWSRADARFALGFWPWSLLAQPAPLPEQLLAASAEALITDALERWGTPAAAFSPWIRTAYTEAVRDPEHAHAICEEYRAATTIDRVHDQADLASKRQIACPLLVLWSADGALGTWYTEEGGPLALWHDWCPEVQGYSLPFGHFFPEEAPQQTADALQRFFGVAVGC